MATYFSTSNNNFSNGAFSRTLAVGDVTTGTVGNMLTTSYNYSPTVASDGSTYYGVAVHLSAIAASPTGTLDLQLSASNGTVQSISYPVSGFTPYDGSNNITTTYPQSWQLLQLSSPVTITNLATMKIGLKTSSSNQVSLIGASLANLDRSYVTTTTAVPAASDVIHVVGSLTTSGLTTTTVNYDSTSTANFGNCYVHNGGVLNFDPTTSINFYLSGANGLQITPSGTVNFGASNSPVLSGIVHTVNLNSSYINVNNKGTLNVYGAYKTGSVFLASDAAAGAQNFTVVGDISNWVANSSTASNGDSLVLVPNLTSTTSFDSSNLSSFPTSDSVRLWTTATFPHVASTYIPSIVNLTRNIKFLGAGASFGYVRCLDGGVANINNAYFQNFNNSTYKGFSFGTNSTGSVTLSNCVLSGTNVASTPAFSFVASKSPVTNVSIQNCNFYNFGATTNIVSFDSLSAHNIDVSNNIVLKSTQNGIYINALSSNNATFSNNWSIGNTQNGVYVNNPYVLSGSVGSFGYRNGVCGSVITGTLSTNTAPYNGIGGYYNAQQGLNIVGTNPALSSTVISNITANNNTSGGVSLSGNTQNLLAPIKLNINGLVANSNTGAGLEAYSIYGNLSSMTLNDNTTYGIKTSIGNGATTFDGVTSLISTTNATATASIGILSGTNYNPFVIKNAYLTKSGAGTYTKYPLSLSGTKFEQFVVESSTLSSDVADVGTFITSNPLEGSYIFNNCTFGSGILSSTVANYQSEVFTETGFAAMKVNGISNNNFRMLQAGKISSDTTLAYGSNTISEKLEPYSSTIKLRCGSKMVPVNKGDTYTVGCYVYKSASYSGAAPRLMLKHNSPLGYVDTVLASSVSGNGVWEQLTGVVPASQDAGIFEVYVDCSGVAGSGSVNIDNWSLA